MNKHLLFNRIYQEMVSEFLLNPDSDYYGRIISNDIINDFEITNDDINQLVDALGSYQNHVTVDYFPDEIYITVHRSIYFKEVKSIDHFI